MYAIRGRVQLGLGLSTVAAAGLVLAIQRTRPSVVNAAVSSEVRGPAVGVSAAADPAASGREPASPTGTQEQAVQLAGVVVDEAGRPVTSAIVSARTSRGAPVAASARTGERGEFRLAAVGGGELLVEAAAPDFATALLEFSPAEASERGTELVLVLRRGHSLAGLALRPDGTPAAGARVSIEDERSSYWRGGFLGAWDTRCDASGRFHQGGLPSGPFRVRAWLPLSDALGERLCTTRASVAANQRNLELRLEAPGVVELPALPSDTLVVVLDPAGTVSGGSPDAFFPEEPRPGWRLRHGGAGTTLEGVEAGERLVLARSADRQRAGWTRVKVPAGATVKTEIELEAAAWLRTTVTTPGAARAERSGITLLIRGSAGLQLRVGDEAKNEEVPLPPGEYRVTAESGGRGAEALLTLLAGERRLVPLVLD